MSIRAIIATIVFLLSLSAISAAGDVTLICNPSVTTSALSRKDVRNIFLGQRTTWDNRDKITFALQKESPVHKIFLKKFVNKTPSQFAAFWKKQIFTGKGSSPQSLNNDKEMIKFISETKGSIGYVSDEADLKNVNPIGIK